MSRYQKWYNGELFFGKKVCYGGIYSGSVTCQFACHKHLCNKLSSPTSSLANTRKQLTAYLQNWRDIFFECHINRKNQLSQPACITEVLQPLEHLRGLFWTCSNRSTFLCWGPNFDQLWALHIQVLGQPSHKNSMCQDPSSISWGTSSWDRWGCLT